MDFPENFVRIKARETEAPGIEGRVADAVTVALVQRTGEDPANWKHEPTDSEEESQALDRALHELSELSNSPLAAVTDRVVPGASAFSAVVRALVHIRQHERESAGLFGAWIQGAALGLSRLARGLGPFSIPVELLLGNHIDRVVRAKSYEKQVKDWTETLRNVRPG